MYSCGTRCKRSHILHHGFEHDCPITSWQIGGETMQTVTDFTFLGSKITVDGDCSHEMKKHLLLGRKAMTNLDSILKSRDITLLTNVQIVKAIVFPVVMYGCESWSIKKAECWKNWCFWTVCYWRRLLRVPWIARRSKQSILKESILNIHWRTDTEAKALKLWPLMWKAHALKKTLMLGKIEGRRRGLLSLRWLDGVTDLIVMSLSKLWGMVKDREAWCAAVHEVTKSWTWSVRLNNNKLYYI